MRGNDFVFVLFLKFLFFFVFVFAFVLFFFLCSFDAMKVVSMKRVIGGTIVQLEEEQKMLFWASFLVIVPYVLINGVIDEDENRRNENKDEFQTCDEIRGEDGSDDLRERKIRDDRWCKWWRVHGIIFGMWIHARPPPFIYGFLFLGTVRCHSLKNAHKRKKMTFLQIFINKKKVHAKEHDNIYFLKFLAKNILHIFYAKKILFFLNIAMNF